MAEFNEAPTEKEALKFQTEHDEQVRKAREGMGYEVEEKTAVVETETETPEDTEETEEEETESEEESEEETEEEEPDSQPRDKSVFRQLNEIRSQKRAAETEKSKALEELQRVLAENTELKKNQPPPSTFVDYAKEQGIEDPKAIKGMYDLFRSELEKDLGSKITALDEKIQSYESREVERQEANAYNESMGKLTDEWSEVLPIIESEYKPTAAQQDEAFALMADLAHQEKYHDKELDYILFKEQAQFEQIFGARKRRTMFSSHGRASGESRQTVKRDGSHESIMALMKEQKAKMHGGDGFDVVENGEI